MDERRLAEIRELDRMGVCQSHETPDMGVAPYVKCDCADEPLEELLAEVDRLRAALAASEAARERLAGLLIRDYTNRHGVRYRECRVCGGVTIGGAVFKHLARCDAEAALAAQGGGGAGEDNS